MRDEQLLKRITINPKVMVGKPVIRGTRLTVEYILNLLAHGGERKFSKSIRASPMKIFKPVFYLQLRHWKAPCLCHWSWTQHNAFPC